MQTAVSNPLTPKNLNSGTEKYRAADVLSQYRIFYEIFTDHEIVHFVWINNDEYLHDSSKGRNNDPCYERFRTLMQTGKLATYQPPAIPQKPTFKIHGAWMVNDDLYARYESPSGHVDASLFIVRTSERTYRINGISASKEKVGLELQLLDHVTSEATKNRISLSFELDLGREPIYVIEIRKALSQSGFILKCNPGAEELWEKD